MSEIDDLTAAAAALSSLLTHGDIKPDVRLGTAQALEHIQRSRMLAYEIEARKIQHQAEDVTLLQERLQIMAAFMTSLEAEFMAGKSPTSMRIAARIRTMLRDAGFESE